MTIVNSIALAAKALSNCLQIPKSFPTICSNQSISAESIVNKTNIHHSTTVLAEKLNIPVELTAQSLMTSFVFKTDENCYKMLTNALKSLLFKVTPDDLKINVALFLLEIPKGSNSLIHYFEIFKSKEFVICVFSLAKGAHLPIHDHPDMTVLSKIISGDLHVKTYILGNVIVDSMPLKYNSRIEIDTILSGNSKYSCLCTDPTTNLHSFTALSDCLIMDVIVPPYDPETRPCKYYQEHSSSTDNNIILTDRILPPPPMTSLKYMGIPVDFSDISSKFETLKIDGIARLAVRVVRMFELRMANK